MPTTPSAVRVAARWAARRERLGTPWNWEVVPLKKPVLGLPGGEVAYVLKDQVFEVEKRYTGIKEDVKRTFRIAPDDFGKGWRLDYWDFLWVAYNNTVYDSPQQAARDLVQDIQQNKTRWTKNAAEPGEVGGGWEPGKLRDDGDWEPGHTVPRGTDNIVYEEEGSQVPPERTSYGEEVDESGEPVSSVDRVAASWAALAEQIRQATSRG